MTQCPCQLELHTTHEIGGGVVGPHRHPDRDDIGDHAAGPAQFRGGACGDGQAQHHFTFARHPRQERSECRDDHRRERGAFVFDEQPVDGLGHAVG